MKPASDVDLVARYLSGDPHGLAAIYDRYADAVYDGASAMLRNREDAADATQDVFMSAAAHLHQLRDPSRLKPWLMAILRNNVYRRTKKRSRSLPVDFTDARTEASLAPSAEIRGTEAELVELAELVRTAAAGLTTRDQLVLELSVRQGLQGDDLADALGVSAQQSYNLVHRMRQRTERALGAVCVARYGRRECDELSQLLADWDGEFTVLVRKRVARHVDDCATCEQSRSKLMPLALFAAAPALVAPTWLRERVLEGTPEAAEGASIEFARTTGFPGSTTTSQRRVGWLLRASVVAIVIAVAVIVWQARSSTADVPDRAGHATPVTTTSTTTTTVVSGTPSPAGPLAATLPSAVATTDSAVSSTVAATSLPTSTFLATESVPVTSWSPNETPVLVTEPPVAPRNGEPLPEAPPFAAGDPPGTTSTTTAPPPPVAAPVPAPTTTAASTTTTTAAAVVTTTTTTTVAPDITHPTITLSGAPTLDCSGFRIWVVTSDAAPANPQPSGVLTGPIGETYTIPFSGGSPWHGLVEHDGTGGALGSGVFTWTLAATDAAGNVGTLSGSTTSTCAGM